MNLSKLTMRAAAALERGDLALADTLADALHEVSMGPDHSDALLAQVACRCLVAGLNRARELDRIHRRAMAQTRDTARAEGIAHGIGMCEAQCRLTGPRP